jgi:hypothetical protein
MASDKEGVQRWLDGMAEEVEYWAVEGIAVTRPQVMLGSGTDLQSSSKVSH